MKAFGFMSRFFTTGSNHIHAYIIYVHTYDGVLLSISTYFT